MAEVAHSGEHHRNAELVCRFDGEVVLLGTTRLNNVADAGIVCGFDVVREREECIGTHHDFTEDLLFESLEACFVDELAVFVEEFLGFREACNVVANARLAEAPFWGRKGESSTFWQTILPKIAF